MAPVRAALRSTSAVLGGLIGAGVLLLSPAISLASSSFKTGLYKGTTSQGYAFEFAVKTGSACGHKHRFCVFTPAGGVTSQMYIDEPCSAGSSANAYVDLNPTPIPTSGEIHNTSVAFSTVVLALKVSPHGTMSGTVQATGTPSSGTSDCTSGAVTFTATRS